MMTRIKKWFAPPEFDNERDNRTAYLLNVISFSYLIVLSSMTTLGVLQSGIANIGSEAFGVLANRVLPLIIAFVAAQILMRRGKIKIAAYAYIILLWITYVSSIWQYGGIQASTLPNLVLAVLIAGLLVGNRGVIILTALSVFIVLLTLILQNQGLIQTQEIASVEWVIAVALNLLLSAVYLSLYIRSLDEALSKSETANKLLEEARGTLEIRVAERTQDLELAAEIGQNVSQIRDLDKLTTTAVSLIRRRFNLYHAQLYLIDEKQNSLVLFASTGDVGEQMLSAGHTLPINSTSINGRAATEKQPVIVSDTVTNDDFKPHALLPDTRSETAVPLIVGDNVVGVLDLQSNQPNTFTEESLPAFVTLAGQLAIAIDNSKLFTEQERLTAEMQNNANFLDTIFNSLPLMLFVKDAQDLSFVRYNQAGANLIGVPVEDLVGKSDYDFFPKEEADFFTSKDREVLENAAIFDIPEEPIQTAHQGTRILHTVKIPIMDAQGQPQYLLSISEDITERKEIETDLVKFKLGMERSIDAIFLTETDGTITYVNDAFTDIYGYTKEDTIGQTPRILKSGVIPQEQYEYFWQTLLSGDIVSGEIVNKTKDGRLVNIEGNNNPILDESGQVIGFLAMHRDISERKQSEETARERENLLRTIVDSTPDLIFIKDVDHRYQMVNQSYANSMHLSPEEFLGKNDIEIGFPEEIVKGNPEKGIRGFWADDREIMESNETKIIDEEPAIVDGMPRVLNTIKIPLKDSEGRITGIVGFVHDITDIKETEKIIVQQANELQTVAELSAIVSSELDTKQLLLDIVNRARESFNLYHTHIYLLDESSNTLNLAAGAGEIGVQMVAANHQIPYDHKNSVVAQAARTKEGVIVNNVMADPNFLPNPLLFETKSEMAVPMLVGNRLLGVLDVQSDKFDNFTNTDINIQTTLAAQIAVALENAHAFKQANDQAEIIRSTPNIIATTTMDGQITFMNESGLRKLGYELDEVLGQPATMFYSLEESLAQRMEGMEALMKQGVYQDENVMMTKSGEQFPVEQLVTLICDEDGQPQLMAVNMQDITERKKVEAAQQALNIELEAQLERSSALQRIMTREGWQAFMTMTADKRPFQGFEFNQKGIKTLTTEDLTNGANGKAKELSANDKSGVINPVTIQGITIGKIGVRNPSGEPLTDEQRELLISLTNQVAEALDRARLFEETELGRQEIEEQATELTTVNDISELVSTQLNIDDLVNAVGSRLMDTFAASSVYLALVNEKTGIINFPYFVHRTDGPIDVPPRTLDEGGGFTAQICRTRQPIIHNYTGDNVDEVITALGGSIIGNPNDSNSYIGVPMIVGDKVIGVIGLNNDKESQVYDEEDVPLLTTLSSTIAVALQNAQQFEDTQRRANREALVNEISQKIQNAATIESALQTAVAELGKALNLKRAVVKLNKPDSNGK